MKKLITTILAVITTAGCHAAPFGLWINANTTNNYSDSSKWIAIDGSLPGGVPGPSNDAYIFDGTLLVGPGDNFNPQQLIMGWENWHIGEYLQTGGTTRVEFWTTVGKAGNQVFNINDGSYSTGDLAVGWTNPGTSSIGVGVFNLNGGIFESRAATFIGLEGATGTVNINGGTFNATGNSWGSFRIADYGTGTGVLNLGGTGVVNASQYTAVGGWGNGTLNITGGTWNQNFGGIVVGDAADLTWTGRGEVNQSGGTVNVDYIFLQKGIYNLNGGNLLAYGVVDTKAETTGVFNFNGGTLQARDNNTDFITADTVEIKSGGGTIDTSNKEVWVSKVITGVGDLNKNGNGTLLLQANNTYTGTTYVNNGTLIVNGSLMSSNTIVATGSVLKGSGSLQSVILQGGILSPGNSPGLLYTTSLDGSNGGFLFELGASTTRGVTYDAVNVENLLTLANTTTWSFTAYNGYTFQLNDSYDLFDWGTLDASTLDLDILSAALPNLDTVNSGLAWDVSTFILDGEVTVIPEPSALSLILIGCGSLIALRRLNRNGR